MSEEFELFPGKTLSGLFQDIYNNQTAKKKNISEVIHEFRKTIRHAGDIASVGQIVKDLIDTSVRNDEQLIKLATIAQRIIVAQNKNEGDDGFLTKEERDQLLQDIEKIEDEVSKTDDLEKMKTNL